MKKFATLLLLLVTTLSFTSCSDDDNGPGSTSELLGAWESVSETSWFKVDGEISYGSENEQSYNNYLYVFKPNGIVDTYERNSSSTSWNNVPSYDIDTFKFKYSGGKIRFTEKMVDEDGDQEKFDAKVLVLNENTLVLEFHEKYKDEGIYYEDYEKITFRKITNPLD